MNLQDMIAYSLTNLAKRQLRSWLTILGMVIGVIAIVVILSVSEGFNRDITVQVNQFGADQMFVYPISSIEEAFSGGSASMLSTSGKLRQRDVDSIEGISGVKEVARVLMGSASISFKDKNITAFVIATDPQMFEMYKDYLKVGSGRIFRENEKNVIFFAYDAANEYFGKNKVEPGSVVQVNGRNYHVVGVQEKIGTSLSAQDDSSLYVPFDDGRVLFRGQLLEDEVGMIMIQVDDPAHAEEIKDAIERKLSANHRVSLDKKDFSVITSAQITEIVSAVLLSVQLVLGAITLIASVVGAIGIANTMFMNVLERVREIGILKSVGATPSEILLLFLIESAMIGLAGGTIGLVLGYGANELLQSVFAIPVFLRLRIIAFVFIFSVGTGVLAGFMPAWRAAKMDPVDALRFE
jgi:putative ABC transport system permease protein